MLPLRGRSVYMGHVIIIIACVVILLPFIWILINSLKLQVDIYSGTLQFEPTLRNYEQLFSRRSNFQQLIQNSALVAIVSTAIVLTVGTLAAYALNRFRWHRLISGGLLAWVLLFHMIPPITLVGPWFLQFNEWGLYNTLQGLILAYVTLNLPMTTWLILSFLQDLPRELEEAAQVDGCRRVEGFIYVVLPLLVPALVAAGLLSFIFSWNEFAVALNLTSLQSQTIPIGISKFAQQNEIRFGEMAASAILSTLPAVMLVFFGQRFIVKGLTLGALK